MTNRTKYNKLVHKLYNISVGGYMNNDFKRFCFVIMPFSDELHYFYLFYKNYLEENFPLVVERGDNRVKTIPLHEKIQAQIEQSHIVIADISGKNANVMYELGIAIAYQKPVVIITKDPVQDVPTDLKHNELIKYDFKNHQFFINKLDNAIECLIKR